jgi:hypothetical protein
MDPMSCEAVTHIVPPPPPMDVREYAEAQLPFYVVNETNNRVDGGDFDNVQSVAAMDAQIGIASEPELDPSKPVSCQCSIRLCDCV